MILSPYDAVVTRGQNLGTLKDELAKRLIVNNLPFLKHPKDDKFKIAVITGKQNFPVFNYPVKVEVIGQLPTYVLDLRLYQRFVKEGRDGIEIDEHSQAALLVELARLIPMWEENPGKVITFNTKPVSIFGNFVGEVVGRKMGLVQTSPDTVLRLQVVFAAYYQLRYIDSNRITSFDINSFSSQLARILNIPFDFVSTIVTLISKDFTQVGSIQSVCDFIRNNKWHPNLDKFTLRDFYAIMNSSGWFGGPNPKEMMLIAMEYPPLFLTMLTQALENKTYKNTPLHQIAKRHLANNNDVNDYVAKYYYFLSKG